MPLIIYSKADNSLTHFHCPSLGSTAVESKTYSMKQTKSFPYFQYLRSTLMTDCDVFCMCSVESTLQLRELSIIIFRPTESTRKHFTFVEIVKVEVRILIHLPAATDAMIVVMTVIIAEAAIRC